MQPLIERSLPDGRSVADTVFGDLDAAGGQLEFVDVGARGGSFMLPPSYAARARLTGFEPNRAEYEKLLNGRTDSMLAGAKEPPFRERRYFPDAVWSENTSRTLYLTVGPGAVTLMGPVDETMTSRMQLGLDGEKNYYEAHQRLVGEDSVGCVSLDSIWDDPVAPINILKIDVEGAEQLVLEGARRLLTEQRILLIFSEFLLVPYYRQRLTLGHQQVMLDELGYRLIGLNHDHAQYSWQPTTIEAQNDRRMTYAGDAIFVLDPDRNALSDGAKYRLGLALMAMGFNSFGLNLIAEAGKISPSDFAAIAETANKVPAMQRLRRAWIDAPHLGYRALQMLGLRD